MIRIKNLCKTLSGSVYKLDVFLKESSTLPQISERGLYFPAPLFASALLHKIILFVLCISKLIISRSVPFRTKNVYNSHHVNNLSKEKYDFGQRWHIVAVS